MDETIKAMLSQMPMVAILLYIQYGQNQAHKASIEYYRAQAAALNKFVQDLTLKFITPIIDEASHDPSK